MALYCLVSAGGSPGVTTTALGLALAWPGRVLMAECDPMGRRVLPGFMADRLPGPAGPGLLGLAMAAQAAPQDAVSLEEYVLPVVEGGQVELLHGIRDPRHTRQLAALWGPLGQAFAKRDGDVVADLGRVGGTDTPVGLLQAADLVVMVLKPTLAHVDAAGPRLDLLKGLAGGPAALGLCLIADGPYSEAEVERALEVPVLAELPCAPGEARVLSDGARPRLTFRTSLLVRSLDGLGRHLRQIVRESGELSLIEDSGNPTATLAAAGGRK